MTSASHGGRRSASAAISSLRSSSQPPVGVDGVLQLRLLFEQLVHLVLAEIRLGELVADRVEAVDQRLDCRRRLPSTLPRTSFCGIELRLLRQQADLDAGLRPRLALDVRVDARHDAQQRRLARAVQAEHADLGAGKERQADVAQDDALRRHHLARRGSSCRCIGPWLRNERGADYRRGGPNDTRTRASLGTRGGAHARRGPP